MSASPRKARAYKPTEAQYKGGARECYVTYDLAQKIRGKAVVIPKVKRVYIADNIISWQSARNLEKRTGRKVRGVRIAYSQSRSGYSRKAFEAKRGLVGYSVKAARVGATGQTFAKTVE